MGYEPPGAPGLKLDFSDTPYAGLEVTMMPGVSLGRLLDIEDLAEAGTTGAVRELVAQFAACMESWNVTNQGEPVPADLDGVLSQDSQFILAIIQAWQKHVGAAPPPLPDGLSSGGTSAEVSIPGLAEASRSLRS